MIFHWLLSKELKKIPQRDPNGQKFDFCQISPGSAKVQLFSFFLPQASSQESS